CLTRRKPADTELLAGGIGRVAHPNFRWTVRCGEFGFLPFHDQLQSRVGRLLWFDRFEDKLDSARPFITLQPVQSRPFLQIRDHHYLLPDPSLRVSTAAVLQGF